MSNTTFLALSSIIFLVIGVVWYNLDRKWGVKIFRKQHNLTHGGDQKLSADAAVGFIYGRPARIKVRQAAILAAILTVIAAYSAHINLLVALVMWVGAIFAVLVGFYLGPLGWRLWQKRETVFNAVDKIERGEITVGTIADGVDRWAKRTADRISGAVDKGKPESPPPSPASEPEPELKPEDLEPDSRAMLDRFTRK